MEGGEGLRPDGSSGADRLRPDGSSGADRLQLDESGATRFDCTFCGIVAGRVPARVLYEDDSAIAFLDIRPLRRGHTLVAPRAHVVDLTAEDAAQAVAAVGPALQQTTRLLIDRLPADGVSLLQANGSAAGQEVFHLHFHLVPRWAGDRPLTDWTPAADTSPDEEAGTSPAAEAEAAPPSSSASARAADTSPDAEADTSPAAEAESSGAAQAESSRAAEADVVTPAEAGVSLDDVHQQLPS